MKFSQFFLLPLVLAALAQSACVTTPVKSAFADTRAQLMHEETFRYHLPKNSDEPVKPTFPKILRATLKNGLHLYVVSDTKLPIAQVSLVFRNGAASDTDGHFGLADLTTRMLKEGAGNYTSLQLAEEFANLGTEVSTDTGKDSASLAASVLSSKVDRTIELLALMAQHPSMPAEEFDRIKLKRQSELEAHMAMPSYAARVGFVELAYGKGHPYAHPVLGTQSSIATIDVKMVKSFHAHHFGPNNAALIVVGDVNFDHIKKTAEKLFGKWIPVKHAAPKIPTPEPAKQMQTHLIGRPNTPQTFLMLGQPVADAHDKDLAVLEVLQQILAGLPTSRLDANLREKRGWTYGVSSAVAPMRGKGPMVVSTSIQVPFGSDALQEILNEFESLKSTKVSAEELNSAKSGILRPFASRYTTLDKVADNIASMFIYDRPTDFDQTLFKRLSSVTSADILRVAQKTLRKEHMVAIAVGDLEAMQIPLAKMDVGIVTVGK